MARTMLPRDAPITSAVVPDQLQKAARELQAAIQSVRRRREATKPPQHLASACDAGIDAISEDDGDKENASFLWNSGVSYTRDLPSKDTRKLPVAEGQTEVRGEDEDEEEDESDGEDALALSQLSGLSGISAIDSDDSDAWSLRDQEVAADQQQEQVTKQVDSVTNTLQDDARRALSWMQQDVERQARDNKSVTKSLVRAVYEISEVIAEAVPAAACRLASVNEMISAKRALAPERVTSVVAQWRLALDEWKCQRATEKQALAERFAAFRDECESRLQLLEATHLQECERLQEVLRHQRQEADQRELCHEDEQKKVCAAIEDMSSKMERLRCENEDLAAHIFRQSNQQAVKLPSLAPTKASSERVLHDPTRELLDLTAIAKEADLRALQWQMAFEEQAEAASQTETRLQMLLEEQLVREDMVNQALRRMVPRQSMKVYQERIGWLEGHVRDMQNQIACDHEQFDYEISKWEQEKQGVRRELDEIRDVSVKLLKMLLIREKLLKKRERKHTSRLESIEHKLKAHRGLLKQVVQTLMEESAALLLVLQQLSVQAVVVPIKPAHVRAMIKQLKRLNRALDKVEIAATSKVAAEEATLSLSMGSNMSETSFDVDAAEGYDSEHTQRCEEKRIAGG